MQFLKMPHKEQFFLEHEQQLQLCCKQMCSHNHSLFLPHGGLIPILPHGGLISTFPHRCLIPVTALCSYSLSYQTQVKVEIIYYLSSKSPIPTHNPTFKHLSSHFQYPQSSTISKFLSNITGHPIFNSQWKFLIPSASPLQWMPM